MKFKHISITVIITLVVGVSPAICQKNGIDNAPTTPSESEKQILKIEEQLETISSSFKRIDRDLNETMGELTVKFNSDISSLEKQTNLSQTNIAHLSNQIDTLRNNTSNLLATAMSPDWTQVGMFWSSMILVLIAVMTTYINYKIFRLQTDPDVIVYSMPDPNRQTIINLVIENIGKGVAKNIKFNSNKPIPCRAFGMDNNAPVPKEMSTGPLVIGIPELGPNSKRVITWGQYYGLLKGLGGEIITITADYSAKKVFLKAPKFKSTFSLDIKSFEGTDASDQNWDKKAAESLGNIADSIKQIASFMKNEAKNG